MLHANITSFTISSSRDETANVNFFTVTSCMYYKYEIQNLLSNEAKVYKNFVMVKSDLQLNLKIIMSISNARM